MNTVKRTNDEWLGLVKQQRASGQSAKAWCKAENISYYTFVDKVTRLRREGLIIDPKPAKGRYSKHNVTTERQKCEQLQSPQWLEVIPPPTSSAERETRDLCVKIGVYEIVVPSAFEEAAFIRICKALTSI